MRIIINSMFGTLETAILPLRWHRQLQILEGVNQTHFADKSGKLLLSIDTMERTVHFADPSVTIEHKYAGRVQLFRGNFISLIPLC